ncbi:interleukin-8-like isoform X1 [Patagioenas fasciata]|uniref:Growth-regulated alpha protein n=1 Tax=Patagioenas fasciata monilis TaxID=372326 RepID=A0A1V4JWG2_PATFA|nr:growth-regulated alpha protein [Patagioenas fasciata monilis]
MNTRLCLVLLLATALCRGSPLAGELRCRCVRTVSEVIPPRRLARVEFVAEGPHCAVPEVIATTKHGQTVCLSPFAPWVKLIVTRILNRYLPRAEGSASRPSCSTLIETLTG